MEKQKRVPALRFPEFVGEWEMKPISSVLKIGSGKDYKHLGEGDIPVFGTGGLMTRVSDFLYDGETVCIGRKGTIDKPMFYSGKLWTVDTLFYTHTFTQTSPRFIYNIFQRINWKEYNEASGVPSLSKSTIEKIDIILPSLPEQQKISTFLTSVDEKLTQLKKKKSLLEQYKKGAMQQILSRFSGLGDEQDGTNPPILQSSKSRFRQLRFKDDNGNEYPEWEEKRLGEIAEIVMGQSPESNSYNSDGLGMPLIQGNADIQNRLSYPRNWTTQSTKRCKIGDLILTVRAPVGAVAKSVHNAYIGRGVCAIRNNSLSNIEFIYQVLLDYELKWIRLEQGSTFTAVSGADIKSIEISIPSLPEQTKIANFLSALDEKIAHCGGQIEKMEQWKKGLLQGMFC